MRKSFGKRAGPDRPSSKVRVYTRPDIPKRIFYSRAWLLLPSGRPEEQVFPTGTTWKGALLMGEQMALQRQKVILSKRDAFGEESVEAPITVGALLERYEASETASRWSKTHRRDVLAALAFWRLRLDLTRPVVRGELSPAVVRKFAGEEARRLGVGPRWERKRLAAIRAAVIWGMDQAQLYDVNPLRGLEMPKYEPETDELIYSPQETLLLVTPHPEVDWRVTLLSNIAADTGRRLSAMLSLTTEDILTDGDSFLLRFRKEYDKGNRTRLVPISEPTALLVADALERDLVKEWGWLFPEGRLDFDDARDKPWGPWAAIDGLHDAEGALGITQVPGRAYHGLKRTNVTKSMEVSHGDVDLVTDTAGNVSASLIRLTYRKGNLKRTRKHVDAIRRGLEEDANPELSTRESTHSGEPE